MENFMTSLIHLSDGELLTEVTRLARAVRVATARLIASLAELDSRRLYLGEGCSSLFVYCTRVLHLSEHAAYNRIEAARHARRFPAILERLADGSVTLTTVNLLGPHLTPDNHIALLDEARHKSKRDVEEIVARLNPRPAAASVVRKLPAPRKSDAAGSGATASSAESLAPPMCFAADANPCASTPVAKQSKVTPLAPERYKLQLTMTAETYVKLRKAQDLLRHAVPSGDPALILDRALTLLIADAERRKLGACARPRKARAAPSRSRHIPAGIRREVWRRDGGQCAFVGAQGRCTATAFLEYHHVVPYAKGGESTVDNISLRCRQHNAHEYDLYSRNPMLLRERRTTYAPTHSHATRSGPSHDFCHNQQFGPSNSTGAAIGASHIFTRLRNWPLTAVSQWLDDTVCVPALGT
jgi:hypothetical protein